MTKTSTRLATIGVVIILGGFAIALAQHDARNRDHDEPITNEFTSNATVPIAVDGDWNQRGGQPGFVRANNDGSPPDPLPHGTGLNYDLTSYDVPETGSRKAPPPENANPLRSESGLNALAANQFDEDSSVVQAAGEGPSDEQSTTPSWLADGGLLPELPTSLPTGPAYPLGSGTSDSYPTANAGTNAQSLPTFPITPNAAAPQMPTAFPALPATLGTPIASGQAQSFASPPTGQTRIESSAGNMSDTQRGVMPATELQNVGGPPMGNNNGGSNYNLQSPTNDAIKTQPLNTTSGSFAAGFPNVNQDAAATTTSQPPTRTAPASSAQASLVSNQPGNRYLDGSQNPILLIQKRAPEEIQVGKKATFIITVRNAGNATAHDVNVVDSVPRGARFEESSPPTTPSPQGILKWDLGEMAAGDERTISLQITPEAQGEVGSVASVHFVAQASVRTIATMPKIELSLESQPDVLIGGSQSVIVTVKNTGTGVARNVRIQVDIPRQLGHESGEAELDAPIGDMRPHEVIQQTLIVAAVQPGQSQCVFRVVTDDGVQAESGVAVDVRAPQLTAAIQGPTLRYLERQATYRVTVTNTGTAAATDLNFVVRLPSGLKYISTTVPSEYDPNTHSLTLALEELSAGQPAPFDLTVLPVELGPQVITFSAIGALGISAEARGQVMVDGLAELAFTIGQDNGTVETGANSTYSVQVTNIGNQADKEVQLSVELPNGAELVDVNAPGVEFRLDGNKLVFAAIPEMKNKDQRTFRFEVRHNQAGNQIVRTQLTSKNWPVAVVKEEGTLVYDDRN